MIFAGDVTPIDVMTHMPAVCEGKDIPYCFVPSRYDLGSAMGVQRGTLMVLIKNADEYNDTYAECLGEINKLEIPYWVIYVL